MASIIGKQVNGRTYYYLAKSARVGGRPRIVAQRYLGTAAEVAAALERDAGTPENTRHLAFGDVAAAWHMLNRLRLAELVDTALGTSPAGRVDGRRSPSAGIYVALAVLNQVVAPQGDLDFPDWWQSTAAPRFVRPRVAATALGGGRVWRALDRLDGAALEAIEAGLFDRIQQVVGASGLVLDLPNRMAFVDGGAGAGHDGTPPPRLAGLGVVVTTDGTVPLISRIYPTGRSRATRFDSVVRGLLARHGTLAPTGEVTVVFDAGRNTRFTPAEFAGSHYVGSVPLGDHPDLLSRSAAARRPVEASRLPGLTALDTRARVFGADHRVILTHSATLHQAQARGFAQALGNAARQLDELADAVARGTTVRSRDRVSAEITRITRARFVDRVLSTSLTGSADDLRLTWHIDEAARTRLQEETFGKQLLVTDHEEWSTADVVTAYRARYHLESTLRLRGDPVAVTSAQTRRWTDRRMAAYGLVTGIAVAVTHLLRRDADLAGIDLSARGLLDALAGIQETLVRYRSTGGRPRGRRLLTERDELQQRLFDIFRLDRYAPQ